ncbi:thioredoxin domain-containing protein [Streptomyces sp. ACA25]|uniref:thioredoxin domain-containing protein n=1 Tax=Streptomyces sp. ACA25 TaxID=3022596 RepID=UPI0023070473|nr:thioredoxin domain-containing protein [Streptomyces sp. ACA25]MDB1088656.1 thioredoxin domain-containing protein [Streptomyces sp. ACA25]
MSKRNTQEAKRAARERLQAERKKQAKSEKIRRQLVVAVSAIGVLVLLGLVVVTIANMGGSDDSTDWDQVATQLEEEDADYATPAHASGEDGLTVLLGDEGAANTFTFYEEPRCPACASFERNVGETVKEGIENGDFNAEFVFGAFFDEGQTGGTGSKNAVSALGAALNVSPEAFLGYAQALYSEEFHTSGSGNRPDDFGSDDRLLEIGRTVAALEDDFATFEDAVNDSTFAAWAIRMDEKFSSSPADSTPTIMLNDEVIPAPPGDAPWNPEYFLAQFEENKQ